MLLSIPARRRTPLIAAALAFVCITPAAYATGLPQQASDSAVAVLAKLGVVPGSHAGRGSGGHGHGASVSSLAKSHDLTGAAHGAAVSALASGGKSHAGASGSAGNQGKGAQVSRLARTTTASGAAKGAAISTLASGGKSQAGRSSGGNGTADAAGRARNSGR
jgi:hypothetical protein